MASAQTHTTPVNPLPLGLLYVLSAVALFGVAIMVGAAIALDGPRLAHLLGAIALLPGPALTWIALRHVDPHMAAFGLVPSALVLVGWIGLALGHGAAFFTIPLYVLTALFTCALIIVHRPR